MLPMMVVIRPGMGLAELPQLLDREAVADHPLVGDDVGRAAAAVEERHLAEGKPGPERGDAHDPRRLAGRHAELDR